MNTATTLGETNQADVENVMMQLSVIRQQKGYTTEYVANKLHLRVRIIELLEQGAFDLLPEAVFVKGYLRAYAKLLSISPDPFLTLFNNQYDFEKKPEKALWQSRRESHKAEHLIRWVTFVFAIGVMVAVGIWWQKNREVQPELTTKEKPADLSFNPPMTRTEISLDDLSKVQTIISPDAPMSILEKKDA